MYPWTDKNVPDQRGRTALVTGATSGLGLRVAEVLAHRGARVLISSRNAERGAAALQRVGDAASDAPPQIIDLDLGDLDSVHLAAEAVRMYSDDRLDLIINNAGIMAPPLGFSPNGLELQWATNVIGPAALTRLLLPAIVDVPRSRIVTVSSLAHFGGAFTAARLDGDVLGEDYHRFAVYARTKMADLLLSRELERYLRRSGAETASLAAHPGLTGTNIAASVVADQPESVQRAVTAAYALLTQPVERGALPLLYAATALHARAAQYIGPRWLFETRGLPAAAARHPAARSNMMGGVLQRMVTELTGIGLPATPTLR
ncbi:MAG: protochlorophyllide oxidoreductase [Glaciihabitans sp.]|nr:protochlorophyllide oxidoreductase [Glaciihabitans sp.]